MAGQLYGSSPASISGVYRQSRSVLTLTGNFLGCDVYLHRHSQAGLEEEVLTETAEYCGSAVKLRDFLVA